MRLHELYAFPEEYKNRKRIGRGSGSGWGKTSGKGHKGQNARAGGGVRPGFEGGQMPLARRLPKRGFNNKFRREFDIVSLTQLDSFDAGREVDNQVLVEAGMVKPGRLVKILANGEITKALTITVDKVSGQARELIEKAGGTVTEAAVATDETPAAE